MNNTEAKFILNAYRPNGRDASDPAMAGALAQVKNDPALGAWFAREQAHGTAVAAKLREVAPPAGLRDAVLAGARASRGGATGSRRAWWLRPQWLAAAAAGVAIFGAAAVWLPWRMAAAEGNLVAFAATDTARHLLHRGHGSAQGELQTALGEPSRKLGAGLPVDFAALRATGCRTLTVGGHDVLEVCFKRDGQWFHCYIGRRADFPALAGSTGPQLAQRGNLAVASWADAAHVFVLASEAGLDAVQRLL